MATILVFLRVEEEVGEVLEEEEGLVDFVFVESEEEVVGLGATRRSFTRAAIELASAGEGGATLLGSH